MKFFRHVAAVLLAALLFSSCASQKNSYPVAFTSDGCSSSPDGPLSDPRRWHQACAVHDYRYWRGGTPLQRLEADRELEGKIATSGNPLMAQIYLLGVRLGGSAWLPTTYRWGYAWQYPFGYRHLTDEEKAALDALEPGPAAASR